MNNEIETGIRPRVWIGAIILACLFVVSATLVFAPEGGDAVAATNALSPEPVSANLARIETMLGQLQTRDEAALHEPLLAMRRAELEFYDLPNAQYEQQLTWWAERFSERLAQRDIPEGMRTGLAIRLAAYQHDALARMDAALASRHELAISGGSALGANEAGRALARAATGTSHGRFDWAVAAALLASVVVAALVIGSRSPASDARMVGRLKRAVHRAGELARPDTSMHRSA